MKFKQSGKLNSMVRRLSKSKLPSIASPYESHLSMSTARVKPQFKINVTRLNLSIDKAQSNNISPEYSLTQTRVPSDFKSATNRKDISQVGVQTSSLSKAKDEHSQENLRVKELIRGCNVLRGNIKERYRIRTKIREQTNKIEKTYRQALDSLTRENQSIYFEEEFRDNW